ncbi:uncharacterized protein LOC124814303 [Hydra vulgaris]|uniref:uncharacterized protein LOC124814303 n=1 Tax=Hydra vulgaris TaxID=6087 RepID=UPI001F5EFDFF|nr:uncharacterized protein LOC124814303 [Hydra vulgaris]
MIEAETVNIKHLQGPAVLKANVKLKQDEKKNWRSHERVTEYNPIFIPKVFLLTLRIIEHHHTKTLHGGVGDTMGSIRERFWIPNFRVSVKKVIRGCSLCKRYRVKPLLSPTKASFRTDNVELFAVSGVDFAGPLKYKVPKNLIRKCYVARKHKSRLYLKLCHDLSAVEFLRI